MTPIAPPPDEATLMARARRLAGHTVGEVGAALGVEVPDDPRRTKGLTGQLVEAALGASAGSRAEPDFPHLGVELKTIPVGPDGRPVESTFVCAIPLNQVAETDFERSAVWKKLARVLFIPVEAATRPLFERRLGAPLLWSPSPAEHALLEADWELLAGLIGAGDIEDVTAHLGEVLQVRPKAAHARARRLGPASDGALGWALPRGFYLRARFTEAVLREALHPDR